ncbi:MAG: tripartite tricarboxylate transporter substrate binding protein [Pseudomonadota bacterium]
MDKQRRKLIRGAAGLLAGGSTLAFPSLAAAQGAGNFPNKPITMIIPSTAGGAADTMGRMVVDVMSKELGQTIVMDYKPGAGGILATTALSKAAPDGYTVLFTTTAPLFYSPHMTDKLAYDPKRDFTYISQVTDGGFLMLANKDVPANNMAELVTWIRAQGKGKVNYGSYGIGTVSHLLSAYLSESRDLGMTHAAYKGEAPFVTDLIAGHIPLGIGSLWTATPHINGGRLRGIAVYTPQRHPTLPNVPTMLEAGFTDADFNVVAGNFLVGPANMPPAVLAKLESAVRKAVNSPQVRDKFLSLGTTPVGGSSEDARKLFDTSQPRLQRLVKMSGATLE